MIHIKPTKEELEASAQKAAEEAEALKNNPPEPTPTPSPSAPPAPTPSPTEEVPSPSEPPPSKEIIKDVLRVTKTKLSESSREAQILFQGKKQLEEQIDEAYDLPEPVEDELRVEFPEWDTFSELEKRLAKDNLHNRKINNRIKEIRTQQKEAAKKIKERLEEVETFMVDPKVLEKFPQLEGRQEEFKKFASKPTRLLLDLEDLTKLFLFEMPSPTKHKGSMFEPGTGGPNDKLKPKDDKISVEEARILRKTDYAKYKEYLKAGKIRTEEI